MDAQITIICCLLLAHEHPSPHNGVLAIADERTKHAIHDRTDGACPLVRTRARVYNWWHSDDGRAAMAAADSSRSDGEGVYRI